MKARLLELVCSPGFMMGAVISLFVGFAIFSFGLMKDLENEMERKSAASAASWDQWVIDVKAQGCRIDTYIQGNYANARAIWRCPDGRVLLGRFE